MTTVFNIMPYNGYSQSAKLLNDNFRLFSKSYKRSPNSHHLNALKTGAKTPHPDNYYIYWGNSERIPCLINNTMNKNANTLTDKAKFFNFLDHFANDSEVLNESLPYYTQNREEAASILGAAEPDSSPILVQRNNLNGHSGEGIVLLGANDQPTPAGKLWVRYIKKQYEYRIHFVKKPGSRLFRLYTQEKLLRAAAFDVPNKFQIRNAQTGWVYTSNIRHPINTRGFKLVNDILHFLPAGVDFGALDIIYNKKHNSYYILEINTAPGLCQNTAAWYATSFKWALIGDPTIADANIITEPVGGF